MPNENQKRASDTPLNPAPDSLEETQRQLEGQRPRHQQSAAFDPDNVDELEGTTPTDLYEGDTEAGTTAAAPDDALAHHDTLTDDAPREGETTDAYKAAEEGLTYIPPIDPPTLPSDDYEGARIASGFASTVFGDTLPPTDTDTDATTALPASDETIVERVTETLYGDSRTMDVAEHVEVAARNTTVLLRGVVADMVDHDNVLAVAQDVAGVGAVVDKIDVRSMAG